MFYYSITLGQPTHGSQIYIQLLLSTKPEIALNNLPYVCTYISLSLIIYHHHIIWICYGAPHP